MNNKSFLHAFITLLSLTCSDPYGPKKEPFKLIWAKEIPDRVHSELVIDDGFLYFGGSQEYIYKANLDGSNIELLRIPNGLSFGKPIIYNDYLVYGTYAAPAFLFVHNKQTLERYWNNADFQWHVLKNNRMLR